MFYPESEQFQQLWLFPKAVGSTFLSNKNNLVFLRNKTRIISLACKIGLKFHVHKFVHISFQYDQLGSK